MKEEVTTLKPYKYVQVILPIEEVQALERHIQKLKETGKTSMSKQEFIRELILKEVPQNDESL